MGYSHIYSIHASVWVALTSCFNIHRDRGALRARHDRGLEHGRHADRGPYRPGHGAAGINMMVDLVICDLVPLRGKSLVLWVNSFLSLIFNTF